MDDDPIVDVARLADALAELAHKAKASQSLDTEDMESAESTAFRLLGRLHGERSDCVRQQRSDFDSATSPLAQALLAWLPQAELQPVPAELAEALQALAGQAERMVVAARGALATHPALASLQIVPAPDDSVPDIGRAATRALRGQGPGSLSQCSQILSDTVRGLTLWPADAAAASRTDVEGAAAELGHLAEHLASLRGLYERARRLEISASNLRTWSTNLTSFVTGALVPRQLRKPSVGPALSDAVLLAQHRAALGRFASAVCRYGLAVFGFLQEKWGGAFAAGASLIIPAALLKQLLASAATVDVSWAGALSKLDPVDGFKLPLVALLIAACLATVWLSFHCARARVLRQLQSDTPPRRPQRYPRAAAFILRNTVIVAFMVITAYSGAALWIWSSGPWQIITPAKAGPANETIPAAPVISSDTARGFAPVLTYGDVRVLRCIRERCLFGAETLLRGKMISLPSNRTLAETESAAFGGDSAIVLHRDPSVLTVGPPPLGHALDVSGSIDLTGIPALDLSGVTVKIDRESAVALGSAIGAAVSRLRLPAPPTRVQLEIPDPLAHTLEDLGASLRAEPAWRSGLLATFERSAGASEAIAEAARRREACESARYRRSLGERFHDGIAGYACPPDH
jgi:hypothetical protein